MREIKGTQRFSALCHSTRPCGSVACPLSHGDVQMSVLDFSAVRRTNMMSTLSNTATCSSCLLWYFLARYERLSLLLLSFTTPLPPNFFSSCAAAESALLLSCQPCPASAPSCFFPPLARHIKWPIAAASGTGCNSDIITTLGMSHRENMLSLMPICLSFTFNKEQLKKGSSDKE